MRVCVKMPKFGLTMTEATIKEWRKAVGEHVGAGEILLVVETEKAEVEVESPATGILVEILGTPDVVIQIGGAIAVIETADGSPGSS